MKFCKLLAATCVLLFIVATAPIVRADESDSAATPPAAISAVTAPQTDATDFATLRRISDQAIPLPVAIVPGDPRIRYIGRFDMSDPAGPRCSWSASTVELWVRATALNVSLTESTNNDEYEVSVDGAATEVLVPHQGAQVMSVFTGEADRVHRVLLVKRTEGFFGDTQFQGFQIPEGAAIAKPKKDNGRHLELIGDSISCGYGDEAKDQTQHFSSQTENAYLSYGDIAARKLGADYNCIAWSGRLMWPHNTMGEVYDRILAADPASSWDDARWTASAVVINLGTNDAYNNAFADPKGWVAGYEAFIARVRGHYPNALIYCSSSPMLSGDKDTTDRALIHQVIQDENLSGDKRVKFLDFATQDASNGYGADWHPSVKTHDIMATVLERALETDLGWKPKDAK